MSTGVASAPAGTVSVCGPTVRLPPAGPMTVESVAYGSGLQARRPLPIDVPSRPSPATSADEGASSAKAVGSAGEAQLARLSEPATTRTERTRVDFTTALRDERVTRHAPLPRRGPRPWPPAAEPSGAERGTRNSGLAPRTSASVVPSRDTKRIAARCGASL